VLAREGRPAGDGRGRLAESIGRRYEGHGLLDSGYVDIPQESGGLNVWIVQGLTWAQQRSRRNAEFRQQIQALVRRFLRCPVSRHPAEFHAVIRPKAIRGKAGFLGQFRLADHFAEAIEHGPAEYGKVKSAVQGRHKVAGGTGRRPVTGAGAAHAGEFFLDEKVIGNGHGRLQQVHLHFLAFAGLPAMQERGQDP